MTANTDATTKIVGLASGAGDGSFVFQPLGGTPPLSFGHMTLDWDGGSVSLGYVQVACTVILADSVTLDATGGGKDVGDSIWPACPIAVAGDASWIRTEMTAGGDIHIVVIVAPNSSGVARSGTVTVKTVFGDVGTVTVTQSGG